MHRYWCSPIPGHALHEKVVAKTNRHPSTCQQPGTKSERRPADNPLINRSSHVCFVLLSVYIKLCLSVLLERRSRHASSMFWKVRGTVVFWANRSVGVLSCPAPPRRSAVRPVPTCPWHVRVLDSTSPSMYLMAIVCVSNKHCP